MECIFVPAHARVCVCVDTRNATVSAISSVVLCALFKATYHSFGANVVVFGGATNENKSKVVG